MRERALEIEMNEDGNLREVGIALHARLLVGEVSARTKISEVFLPLLIAGLGRRFPRLADPHLVDTAAADALMSYFRQPQKYDPDRGSLIGYLYLNACGRLLNSLKHHRRLAALHHPVDQIEAVAGDGNPENRLIEEASMVMRQIDALVSAPDDREMIALMMDGVRDTSAYAEALGIEYLPAVEQAIIVKRHKDRLKAILRRGMKRIVGLLMILIIAIRNTAKAATKRSQPITAGLAVMAFLFGASVLQPPPAMQTQDFAYISNYLGGSISVIDTATNTVVSTLGAAPNPLGVAVNSTGTRLYVANASANRLSVIDPATNTVVATIGVGVNPHGVAINAEGTRVYVVNNGFNTVSVIDTATNSVVATVGVGNYPQFGIAINQAGTRLYVVNSRSNDVSVIDTTTNAVVASIPVGVNPLYAAINPAGTRVYVTADHSNDMSVIDTTTNTVVATVGVGVAPQGVAVHPSGARVYVANPGSNDVSVINTATNTVVATVGVGDQPAGVAINSAGTYIYVANNLSNNISVIDTAANTVVATVPVGSNPITVAFAVRPPNNAPVASCQDVTVSAGPNCLANASIDNGSFDPDGDSITFIQEPPGPYPIGNTLVTLTVIDSKGASSQCTAIVTVNDTQPPAIACPANIGATAAVGQPSTIVAFSAPAVSDNCSVTSVSCSPPSGSVFPIGRTTVTCIATDPSSNQSACAFTVAVSGTLLVDADAFLRQGADNTNEGANERLRIQSSGHNRVVVRFNLAGIPTEGLQSVRLILNIAENSDNWGATGRLVDAHRLLVDWIEGNGRNDVMVGGGSGFRGTGEGATWKCAKDADINNQQTDCDAGWDGGTFAAATAAGALHINNQTGEVIWNVTADVLAGVNHGWLIRKREEGQPGQVRYYSREGAALAGNSNLAPRLVLVYTP